MSISFSRMVLIFIVAFFILSFSFRVVQENSGTVRALIPLDSVPFSYSRRPPFFQRDSPPPSRQFPDVPLLTLPDFLHFDSLGLDAHFASVL